MDLIKQNYGNSNLTNLRFKDSSKRSLVTANSYTKDLHSIISEIETASQIIFTNLQIKDKISTCINYLENAKLSPSKLKRYKVVLMNYLVEIEKQPLELVKVLFNKKSLKIKSDESKTGKAIDVLEVINTIENYKSNRRPKTIDKDLLIIKTLYKTALRISDLVNLTNTGWSLKDGYYSKNIIIKKTKNEHTVHIEESLFNQIKTLFDGSEYLFESEYAGKDGAKFKGQFTRQAINKRLSSYGLNPHSFRHSIATDLAKSNVNAKVIQSLLGHSDVQTTVKYYFHDSYNPTIHGGKI